LRVEIGLIWGGDAWVSARVGSRETLEAATCRQQWRRQRGGGGDGVEERVVAWRLEDVNVRERHFHILGFCVFNFV
jgi:hypothetical protein